MQTSFSDFPKKLYRILFGSPQEIILSDLLCQNLLTASRSERMQWIQDILYWLFRNGTDQLEVRFKFFFQLLQRNQDWREHLQKVLSATLGELSYIGFFSNVGYSIEHGLWSDIASRISRKFIPSMGVGDFQEIVFTVFQTDSDIQAVQSLSDSTLEQLRELILHREELWKYIEDQIQETLLILGTHIAHYGITPEIVDRSSHQGKVSDSSFIRLANTKTLEAIRACEEDIERVYANMEEHGVSVDIVNRLETASAMLNRMRVLLDLKNPKAGTQISKMKQMLADAASAEIQGLTIWGYIRQHFYLLSKKIVERNGHSGEHYIARTGLEFSKLFKSALGGGMIVVLMTIFKVRLIHLNPPPFFMALGIWIIYSLGFLGMQFTGATLATKIPSFIASRLANQLKNLKTTGKEKFQEEFRLTLKSQAIALFGNIAGLIPFALLIQWSLSSVLSGSLMDEPYAQHTLHDVNPIFSFSALLGALTGVQLWLSSMAGGWFENWIVFNRIPAAIANQPSIKKTFGNESASRLGNWVLNQSSGIATNITLGFLFGFVPLLGTLFGLNWNGNHVTISSASAVFAVTTLDFQLATSDWIYLISGILIIALTNFGVSFCLALLVAGSAERLRFRRLIRMLYKSM